MLVDMLSETHRPFMTVLTKADKIKDEELDKRMKDIGDYMKS
jgi:GTP-binding protein EngB required for normal cell division